jgi:hypothetical protein
MNISSRIIQAMAYLDHYSATRLLDGSDAYFYEAARGLRCLKGLSGFHIRQTLAIAENDLACPGEGKNALAI